MNKLLLQKIALTAAIIALVAAVGTLIYAGLGTKKVAPQYLSDTERETIANATLPGAGEVLKESTRASIQDAVVTEKVTPVLLSPDDRRAAMQVMEQ